MGRFSPLTFVFVSNAVTCMKRMKRARWNERKLCPTHCNRFQNMRTRQKDPGILCWRLLCIFPLLGILWVNWLWEVVRNKFLLASPTKLIFISLISFQLQRMQKMTFGLFKHLSQDIISEMWNNLTKVWSCGQTSKKLCYFKQIFAFLFHDYEET